MQLNFLNQPTFELGTINETFSATVDTFYNAFPFTFDGVLASEFSTLTNELHWESFQTLIANNHMTVLFTNDQIFYLDYDGHQLTIYNMAKNVVALVPEHNIDAFTQFLNNLN